jgi:hypothetical protein
MLKGTCHCGAVSYEAEGKILRVSNCHCEDCRKISGATYNTALVLESDGFRVVRGEENVTAYESSKGKFRTFCRTCGTPIYTYMLSKPEIVIIRAGVLDDATGVKPQMHIWVKAKAPWHEILDDLQQYQEGFVAK